MREMPSGVVTFLFTDIEGSTRQWERDREIMRRMAARHDTLLRGAITEHDGAVFKTVGDGFCAAFSDPAQALAAAISAQWALAREPWQPGFEIRARMALHTGTPGEQGDDYFGPPVNRVARLMAAGHGGQILLSEATSELVQAVLPDGVVLRDMGEHRLKDLSQPEHIFQVVASGLRATFPPLNTLDYRPNNLPAQPTPFLGREHEVQAAAALLAEPAVRLLTLTGPGGIGKTRLALQVAAEVLEAFPDGATFVPLAALADASLVASAIAGALGLKEEGDRPLVETLLDYLRSKQLLLILDNFEHLLPAAPLVVEVLTDCLRLKVLVTSRANLRVSGEHEYPVPPLSSPDPARLPDLETLSRFDAVALFTERTQAVRPGFVLTAENARPIAEICHRLDGLPLAIELAAARSKLFPPAALLARLSSRLKLLTGGPRDRPSRQQTLRGAIDWSYSLLREEDQGLFARLSVFAGGCTLEAAEAVCDENGSVDVLNGMAALVENSLLRQTGEQEPRFSMLETIREYAREHLEAELGSIERRHAEYYVELGEQADFGLRGPEQDIWLARLDTENDNFRAALTWAMAERDAELALRFGAAVNFFWQIRGYLSEGREWIERSLEQAGAIRTVPVAKALNGLGWLILYQGDFQGGRTRFEDALSLARQLDDEDDAAAALCGIGTADTMTGEYDGAQTELEQALALYRKLKDAWGVAASVNMLGMLALCLGDFERAGQLLEEGLELARRLGQRRGMAIYLFNLGYVSWCRGDYHGAKRLYEEALPLCREAGDKIMIAMTLNELGMVTHMLADAAVASDYLAESLQIYRDTGHAVGLAEWLENQARVAAMRGEPDRAALLHGAASAARDTLGAPLAPTDRAVHERDLAAARESLGSQWPVVWEDGRSLSLEQAVEYALGDAVRT